VPSSIAEHLPRRWTSKHHDFLSAPPHPSPLMFYLHRARLIQLILNPRSEGPSTSTSDCPAPLQYARDHLFPYMVSSHQQEIYHLLGALLYTPAQLPLSPYADLLSPSLEAPALVPLFRVEFCRLHGWAREDPLAVVVDLGAGGALGKIEKARKVMKERLGEVRVWEELPVRASRGSSDDCLNYPRLLSLGLSLFLDGTPRTLVSTVPLGLCLPRLERTSDGIQPAQDALLWPRHRSRESDKAQQTWVSMLGWFASLFCGFRNSETIFIACGFCYRRRAVKCPYCPQETAIASATRLYF